MTTLLVGSETYPDIAAALLDASSGDTLQLESGYSHDAATITVQNLFVDGEASSRDIDLTLGSGIGNITLLGQADINVSDNALANVITGNDGDNVIGVSAGADVAHGGLGRDRLIIDYRAATSTIVATTVNVTDGGTHSVTYDGFESLTLWTGSGNDTVTTGEGDDKVRTFDGNDTITIGGGHSNISAGAGNDTVTTGDGGDKVNGGRGDDIITTGAGKDVVDAAAGNDTVNTLGGGDRVLVNSGIDTVDMGAGKDILTVNYAHSSTNVSGGVASGSHAGGYGGLVSDAGGNSVSFVGAENFVITTGHGDDTVVTGAGHDVLNGRDGDDRLDGAEGHDLISGGIGHDTLIGGRGQDVMTGGDGGGDTFIFNRLDDSKTTAMDVITDLQASDTLNLSAIDADTGTAGNQAFTLVGAFDGHAGQATFLFDAGSNQTLLSLDVDGDGTADFRLAASGDHTGFAGFVL